MTTLFDPPHPLSDGNGAAKLYEPFLLSLPISGASVTVIAASGTRLTLGSSDEVAARIDEMQFELGEGPQLSVARSGEVVAISDVASDEHADWPVLGAALTELGIGALFSIPIRMGAVTLGVASLYCRERRTLTAEQTTTALAIASAIAGTAVHLGLRSAGADEQVETVVAPALRREVHQATGVILATLNTTATIAYSRLQAYAFSTNRPIQDVAHDVVTGSLSIDEIAS